MSDLEVYDFDTWEWVTNAAHAVPSWKLIYRGDYVGKVEFRKSTELWHTDHEMPEYVFPAISFLASAKERLLEKAKECYEESPTVFEVQVYAPSIFLSGNAEGQALGAEWRVRDRFYSEQFCHSTAPKVEAYTAACKYRDELTKYYKGVRIYNSTTETVVTQTSMPDMDW